jgi:DNA-binding transcriptional MerR regulator
MTKSPDAFRTISEVADWLGVQAHVLRFWESKFTQVKPVKRAGGRRYYRPADMLLIGGIKHLLHTEGMTIKGVQKVLREQGAAHVSSFSQSLDESAAGVLESNVVPFDGKTAREESVPDIDTPLLPEEAETAPDAPALVPGEAASEAAAAEVTAGLPSFLTEPLQPIADSAPPRPRVVDAPDPPEGETEPPPEGALSKLARLTRIDAVTAREITPYAARLAVLRDGLASPRKE